MDINNLTSLLEIDENLVIKILKTRFDNNIIYTNIDDILIAINPYKILPIYDDYETNPIYNIAQKSIDNLKISDNNQTILISGNSGSGKTFSTKCIITYFAHNFSINNDVCQRIINANPIIELFGNAQTTMNDNSSRFGKFIKIYFNNNVTEISGIQIDTYLLEKSRVCYQNNDDFNFHIFNQLAIYNNKSYKYCLNPKSPTTLKQTIDMMLQFGFNKNEINNIIDIINLILDIGNNKHFDNDNINEMIFQKTIVYGQETITKTLSGEELEKNKFTICTQLYQICFEYIIKKINIILNPNNIKSKFIGLLDIFGFEIFKYNNFEQLCINYTNEKLQHYHNFIIFQHEQELYKKENINWNIIEYKDNQQIIDIYENKYGIINLLDE